jgi:hypothetical protein
MKNKLETLREENNGYNPEKLENHFHIFSDLGDSILVKRKDEWNGNKDNNEEWMRVHAESEEEFIILFPKVYGIIHEGKFYIHSNDYNA